MFVDSTDFSHINGGARGSETWRKRCFVGCSLGTPPCNARKRRTTTDNIDAGWRPINCSYRFGTIGVPERGHAHRVGRREHLVRRAYPGGHRR